MHKLQTEPWKDGNHQGTVALVCPAGLKIIDFASVCCLASCVYVCTCVCVLKGGAGTYHWIAKSDLKCMLVHADQLPTSDFFTGLYF